MEVFNPEYEKEILRGIEWYTKKRGKLAGEEELKGTNIMELRQFYGIKDPFVLPEGVTYDEAYDAGYDPYMVGGCYVIDEEKAKLLQPFIGHKMKLDKYDYFLCAYQRPTSEAR